MKRKWLLLFLLLTLSLGLSACTMVNENKSDDARKIAIEQFGFDDVWTISAGTTESVLIQKDTSKYIWYVLGERDGEEVLLIVPAEKDEDSYEVDWPFADSFVQIIGKLNAFVGEDICTEEKFGLIEFMDRGFDSFDIQADSLDVAFVIVFGEYYIGQIDGETVVINAEP